MPVTALEAVLRRWAPPGRGIKVIVASWVPPGSSLGTSASVVVALIAALQALGDDVSDPATLARAAHEIETVELGLQSGVQDQIAAAHGGANLIEIGPYPEVEVHALELAPSTWDALTHRIVTVYLGASHQSSSVHEEVIANLASTNGEALLGSLRTAAKLAAAALVAGNIDSYGEAMIAIPRAKPLCTRDWSTRLPPK